MSEISQSSNPAAIEVSSEIQDSSTEETTPLKANSEHKKEEMVNAPVLGASEFKNLTRPKVISLALIFAGLQLIQELITDALFTQYTIRRETYEIAMLYSCFQQMGTVLVALALTRYHQATADVNQKQPENVAPSWPSMMLLALLVFASTALPNFAVEFVYFPAKVVAKSTKLVPTMIVSVLMGNSKKFSFIDYTSAMLLCSGAVGFALNSGRVDVNDDGIETVREHMYVGLMFLAIASFADALVPNLQQSAMKAGASAEQVAFRVNSVGAAWVFVFLFFSGALQVWFFELFFEEPVLLVLMIGGAASLGIAVLAYTMLIREAGSVVAVAIATARKVLTLTLSYVVFPGRGKTFGAAHAISAIAVAVGMALGPISERIRSYKKLEDKVVVGANRV